MKLNEILSLIEQIHCPGWTVLCMAEGPRHYIHVNYTHPPMDTHNPDVQLLHYGQNFVVHDDDTQETLLRRVYTAMQFRVIHELSEQFTYNGHRVFDQHDDPYSIQRIRDLIMREEVLL